jgi:acetyl esterase
MAEANPHHLALEPAAQAFVEATNNPPYLFQLPPEEGRKAVDAVQDSEIVKPDVDETWVDADGVRVRIVKPQGATGALPVILYIHGAGWVFGDAHTHDRLVRDLAIGAEAAVVFPEYDRSPEARFPTAIEQSWTAATGRSERAPPTGWTAPASPSPATPSAAT